MGFDQCMNKILEYEGAISDHPQDPGGLTKYGITKREYPLLDIEKLTKEDAKTIYFKDYWLKFSCDLVPDDLQFAYFDTCINMGGPTAARMLQKTFNLKADGVFGPQTKERFEEFKFYHKSKRQEIVQDFLARRMYYYGSLSTFKTFGLGWSRRLMDVAFCSSAIIGG